LIDGVEEDVKTRSELEYAVESLTEDIKKLNIKIEEQEKLLQQREGGAGDDLDIPEDIKILKEMIQTQREELTEKDHEIELLKEKNESSGSIEGNLEQLESELRETKSSLAKLTEEIEMYKTNDENAREMLTKLSEENAMYKANEENSIKLLEELAEKEEKYKKRSKELAAKLEGLNDSETNMRSSIFAEFEAEKEQLTVNNIKYVEKINELEAQLQKITESSSDESSSIESEMEELERKNKNYLEKINDLEAKLQKFSESAENGQEVVDAEKEFLKEKNLEHEETIKNLENQIQQLSQQSIGVVEVEKDILTEQTEKYKTRIKELQKQVQKLSKTSEGETSHLEAENEKLAALNVEYIKKISDLEAQLQESTPLPVEEVIEEITHEEAPEEVIPEEIEPPAPPQDALSDELFYESSSTADEIPPEAAGTSKGFADSKRKCPKCGNQRKALIHEELDKNNIIMSYPRMYGKKYRCGECGSEWRVDMDGASIVLKEPGNK
jgi:chromosome segregation ATPase